MQTLDVAMEVWLKKYVLYFHPVLYFFRNLLHFWLVTRNKSGLYLIRSYWFYIGGSDVQEGRVIR